MRDRLLRFGPVALLRRFVRWHLITGSTWQMLLVTLLLLVAIVATVLLRASLAF